MEKHAPMIKLKVSTLLPPKLTKGKGIPTTGANPMVIIKFTKA